MLKTDEAVLDCIEQDPDYIILISTFEKGRKCLNKAESLKLSSSFVSSTVIRSLAGAFLKKGC